MSIDNKQRATDKCRYDSYKSPIGNLYLIFKHNYIKGLAFQKPALKKNTIPVEFKNQLDEYFTGKRYQFNLKISIDDVTNFERNVLNNLNKVSYGETRTYKWLAKEVGNPKAVRAVGQALKRNPLPIIIPCHRIIESNGSLGGYASGVDIKRRLLELEYYSLKRAEDK